MKKSNLLSLLSCLFAIIILSSCAHEKCWVNKAYHENLTLANSVVTGDEDLQYQINDENEADESLMISTTEESDNLPMDESSNAYDNYQSTSSPVYKIKTEYRADNEENKKIESRNHLKKFVKSNKSNKRLFRKPLVDFLAIAIASLIAGIIAVLAGGGLTVIFALAAIICGLIIIITFSDQSVYGKGMAIVGLILGILALII